MANLSNSLVKQFAKTVTQSTQKSSNQSSTALATLVKEGNITYAVLDGSTFLTPVSMSMSGEEGDRVLVTIQNHSAIVTANITAPAATTKYVERVESDLTTFKDVTVKSLLADYIKTDELESTVGNFGYIKSDELESKVGDFGFLTAEKAELVYVKSDELESKVAKFNYVKVGELNADVGKLGYLKADEANLKYANIDLGNVNNAWIQNGVIIDGSIGSAAIHDGAITNVKIADATIEAAKIKSINADVIDSGTIKTKRLIITDEDGNDSIVKAINLANGVAEADANSKKIQAAAIEVVDLSAFQAKIAGFDISGNAIYSGKTSIKDPTSGIYASTVGIGMGDGSLTGKKESPLQAYADGSFRLVGKNSSFDFNTVTGELDIEASSLKISSKVVATQDDLDEVRDEISTLLRIESSRGTVFKNDQVVTVLSVVIYHGKKRITDSTAMKEVFGAGAYLQWYWQRLDDDSFGVLSSTDSRFGDEGFTFTLSPNDVDTKITFMCELIV